MPTATRTRRAAAAPEAAAVSATATATGLDYTPRAPQRRGEIRSWTPLHLRERLAFVRCYQHDHPQQRAMALGASGFGLLEHYRTTFPAISDAGLGVLHVLGWLVGHHFGFHPAPAGA